MRRDNIVQSIQYPYESKDRQICKNSLLLGQGTVSYAHAIAAFNEQTENWEASDRRSVPVLKVLCKHSLNTLKQRTKTFSLRTEEIRGR